MKEFIDKLIGRLEEWSFEAEIVVPASDGYDDTVKRQIICTKNAVGIANELAEEYKNGWIPCSERLPEADGYVLCSVKDKYAKHNVIISQFKDEIYWHNGRIIAWMPLPEPYKEGSE